MPKFGKTSRERLETCDWRLKTLCKEIVEIYDITILCGHRSEEEQNKAFKNGKSRLKFPESKHNKYPSKAVDIAPYPIDWEDPGRFYYLCGLMTALAHTKGWKIRWGGDWDMDKDFKDQNFNDLPHFEILD